jgi:hypothetical protein
VRRRLVCLSAFALAMAWFEAALVVYLRTALHPENVVELFPLRLMPVWLWRIELGRELSTLVMLAAVALLAERSSTRRAAAFLYLFGLWDILYYVWLEVMIGWPQSWMEWDVLFLIPWVWLGPWICPALIAVVFVVWGARALGSSATLRFSRWGMALLVAGGLLALLSFLEPAARVILENGVDALDGYSPGEFLWLACVPGVVLMAAGLPWSPPRSPDGGP